MLVSVWHQTESLTLVGTVNGVIENLPDRSISVLVGSLLLLPNHFAKCYTNGTFYKLTDHCPYYPYWKSCLYTTNKRFYNVFSQTLLDTLKYMQEIIYLSLNGNRLFYTLNGKDILTHNITSIKLYFAIQIKYISSTALPHAFDLPSTVDTFYFTSEIKLRKKITCLMFESNNAGN